MRFLPRISVIFVLWQPRQISYPALRVFSASGDDESMWHWLHILFATGWCGFPNAGASGLWQVRQIPGTSVFRSARVFAEPCGVWQLTHPFSTGLCWNLFPAICLAMRWWQPKQSAFPAASRLFLYFAAWGSWHFTQFPSSATWWVLLALPGTIPSWHERQIRLTFEARSFP